MASTTAHAREHGGVRTAAAGAGGVSFAAWRIAREVCFDGHDPTCKPRRLWLLERAVRVQRILDEERKR